MTAPRRPQTIAAMFEIKHSATGALPAVDYWLNLPMPATSGFEGETTWDLLERWNHGRLPEREAQLIAQALEEMPHFELQPMTTGEYEEARARSTVLKTQFKVGGARGRRGAATATLEGNLQRSERIFHEGLLKKRVRAVRGMQARDVDTGEVETVSTIERFLEIVQLSQGGTEYIDQLVDGLIDESTLDAGSKKPSPSQRAG